MSNGKGVVEKIGEFKSASGATMYNLTISGDRFGFGSNKPNCNEGDTIEFEYEQKGQYKNGNSKSVTVVAKSAGPVSSGGGSYGKTPATQTTISKQAALNSALAFVNILVAAEAVPGVTKTAKAEDKYGILESLVVEKTHEYYAQSTGAEWPEEEIESRPIEDKVATAKKDWT